jgi:enamine deaminase RidA (YjgF/YER057c/UK114 family)
MLTRRRALAGVVLLAFLAGDLALGQRRKKKDEEPITQTLEVAPDPPAALTVETKRLGFVVAPLSGKGLLSQQVRDGLKALQRLAKGAALVKIRAFVAGTGDLRRVQTIVAEELSAKRIALPVMSVVQVGGLPLDGAQVQMEAFTQTRKAVNPHGVAFLSGQDGRAALPAPRVAGLAAKSAEQLKQALEAGRMTAADMLRITCLASSLDDAGALREAIARAFPAAPLSLVQAQRLVPEAVVECEAVARLTTAPAAAIQLLNPEGLRKSPHYSQVALVGSPHVVLAGTQMAFRYTEADARLAFQRLEKTLQAAGTSLKHVVMMNTYPLSNPLADLVRKVRFDYLDAAHPPASTLLPLEGLPGMDASFGLEVVAVPPREWVGK